MKEDQDWLSAREKVLTRILLVLTSVTGVVDAISVLGLGRVFTANMTGNVVLFINHEAVAVRVHRLDVLRI